MRLFDQAKSNNMEQSLVLTAVDCFKKAKKLAMDKDNELEIRSEAFLGEIYYKVLKNE